MPGSLVWGEGYGDVDASSVTLSAPGHVPQFPHLSAGDAAFSRAFCRVPQDEETRELL